MYIQQGDVILKRQATSPAGLADIAGDLLYKGQNHHHRVRGQVKIAKHGEDTWLLSNGAELFHEEHKTLQVPEGAYRLEVVKEYDHFLEESRNVID